MTLENDIKIKEAFGLIEYLCDNSIATLKSTDKSEEEKKCFVEKYVKDYQITAQETIRFLKSKYQGTSPIQDSINLIEEKLAELEKAALPYFD
ncbi:Uncharacterised protein [uncultured archaeon]|nr:Uncharacterised protein [uncultured archaeon]